MPNDNLELGAVFQPDWHSTPLRVLAFDRQQVMYDVWSTDESRWGINSLNQRISYYRLPTSLLLDRSLYLRTDEYSELERAIHRPDLPFSFGANATLDWPMICPGTVTDFPGRTKDASVHVESQSLELVAPQIYLSPFGPKGGSKPSALITAANGRCFMIDEILWRAARLQFSHLRDDKVTQGVGIYRSGIQKTLPSFYIWGAKSRMDI